MARPALRLALVLLLAARPARATDGRAGSRARQPGACGWLRDRGTKCAGRGGRAWHRTHRHGVGLRLGPRRFCVRRVHAAQRAALPHARDHAAALRRQRRAADGRVDAKWPKGLTQTKRAGMVDAFLAPRWFKTVTRKTWVANNFVATDYSTDEARGKKFADLANAPPLPVLIRSLCEFHASDVLPGLVQLELPLLLIQPAFTKALRDDQARSYLRSFFAEPWQGQLENRPNTKTLVVEDAGILVMDDQPSEVDAAIAAFREGSAARPSATAGTTARRGHPARGRRGGDHQRPVVRWGLARGLPGDWQAARRGPGPCARARRRAPRRQAEQRVAHARRAGRAGGLRPGAAARCRPHDTGGRRGRLGALHGARTAARRGRRRTHRHLRSWGHVA